MKDAFDQTLSEINARIEALGDRRGVPERIRLAGLHVLRRLSAPVRVTLMGWPGAGKTTLVNMLAGQEIIAPGRTMPPYALTFGPARQVTRTSPAGEIAVLAGAGPDDRAVEGATFLQIEAPVEAIRGLSLLELVTGPDPAQMRAAMAWAARRTDICLWCGQGFSELEMSLWAAMPDRIKDHAFLVLTRADEIGTASDLAAHMAALSPVVASEFHSAYAVASLQGLCAQMQGDVAGGWVTSGGKALADALHMHAAKGRQEDLDNALLFLDRHERSSRRISQPRPGRSATSDSAASAPAVTLPKPSPACAPACAEAVLHLTRGAARLAEQISDDMVLSCCLELAEELTDILSPLSADNDNQALDDVYEAAEMITLLQLEGGAGPAADAVSLLAQLKRELGMRAAA